MTQIVAQVWKTYDGIAPPGGIWLPDRDQSARVVDSEIASGVC